MAMNGNSVRVGIVGLGKMGLLHARFLAAIEGFILSAVRCTRILIVKASSLLCPSPSEDAIRLVAGS